MARAHGLPRTCGEDLGRLGGPATPGAAQSGSMIGASSGPGNTVITHRSSRAGPYVAEGYGPRLGGVATRLVQIHMKARDDSALGRFWAEALDWGVSSEAPGVTNLEPEGFVYPDPAAVCIDIVADPQPKTVKNRVHIDLATTSAAHQADLVARLQELGATRADAAQGGVSWTVLADPEGNEFCVLEPRPIYRDTGPIAAVVVDCADPPVMARFWDEAMDWTLHEVTDDHAVLRSARGVGPYLEFVRTPDVNTVWNRPLGRESISPPAVPR